MDVDFRGLTAIVTGGNGKGKSTLLRGLPDAIRGNKPEIILKENTNEGKGTMWLTTGERFEWVFDDTGTDKLTYFTKEGVKSKVTKELGAKFFPETFDIDKFLRQSALEQSKTLQKVLGIDLTASDKELADAIENRKVAKRDLTDAKAKLTAMGTPEKVDFVVLTDLQAEKEGIRTKLNNLYLENVKANKEALSRWEMAKIEVDEEVAEYNSAAKDFEVKSLALKVSLGILRAFNYPALDMLDRFIQDNHKFPEQEFKYPEKPTPIEERPDDAELVAIDAKILKASEINTKAQAYIDFRKQEECVETLWLDVESYERKVTEIRNKRNEILKGVTLPEGLEFTDEGLTFNGLSLGKMQQSSSELMIIALELAYMNLGAVKTLYFDATLLDRNNLIRIQEWADQRDLQLLIERVDFDGGEIQYELVENEIDDAL